MAFGGCDPVAEHVEGPNSDSSLSERFEEIEPTLNELRELMIAEGVESISRTGMGRGDGVHCSSRVRSGRFPWRCRGAAPERETANVGEAAAYLGIPAGRAELMMQAFRRSGVRSISRNTHDEWVVFIMGSDGSWSKAYVWLDEPPETTAENTMLGPTCGTVHLPLRERWYLRRTGCIDE
jgi:hypothetical protein